MAANSNSKRYMAGFIAGVMMVAFVVVTIALFFKAVPKGNADYFHICLIALVGFVGTAVGYYLGSADSSARKNDSLFPTKESQPAPVDQEGFISPALMVCLSLICLAVIGLSGCSMFSGQSSDQDASGSAAKLLLSVRAAIIQTATAADKMCSAGTLDQGQCNQVAIVYGQSMAAYDVAADALETAIQTETADSWDAFAAREGIFLSLANDLTTLAGQFGLIKDEVKP